MTNISAPAISRIISANTEIKKARSTGWSTGFYVVGMGEHVEVGYQDTNPADVETNLTEIVETINGRADQKYVAKMEETRNGASMVVVTVRPLNQEDHMEKLAEESPYGVTRGEVLVVLNKTRRFYEFDDMGAGFVVTREEAPNDRLVRVTYKDHSHTTYSPETGGRDVYAHRIVTCYAEALVAAGYSACVDYDDNNGDSILVGQAGEFESLEDAAKAAREPLMALREAVEAADLSFMTRKAGATSIHVYYLESFKNRLRRCEVFWGQGFYKTHGRFHSAVAQKTPDVARMVDILRDELAD